MPWNQARVYTSALEKHRILTEFVPIRVEPAQDSGQFAGNCPRDYPSDTMGQPLSHVTDVHLLARPFLTAR